MTMSSGMYANALIRSLSNLDSVNLTTVASINAVIVGVSPGDISANFVSTTTNVVSYAATGDGGTAGTKGWAELVTGHGYTQQTPTSGFAASAFSAATNKLQWPAASENFVWTASDSTGIVQLANTGIVVYWKGATPWPLLVYDFITGANSATGTGATYTATWASGVFTIQIV